MTDSPTPDGDMPATNTDESYLCVLAKNANRRFDLLKVGDGFIIRPDGDRAADRAYETLPTLLSGLQSFFLEFRVASSPAQGFAELARAQEKARSDVIEASRRIYAAIDGPK
jgi:hypothetical protein